MTSFDQTRRELLKLSAVTSGALAMGELWPGIAEAAEAASAAAAQVAPAPAPVDVLLRVNRGEHRLALDPRGQCGACTVLMDGKRVKSCLSLAALVDGREITTIEGVTQSGKLHPLQAAFVERDAFQCGYCTPGQIMAGIACISEGHAGSAQEVRDWMSGNVCRCGAYDNIVAAIQDAGRAAGSAKGG